MKYPLVRELAVDGIPVTVTCRALRFSSQGYYKWLANPLSKRDYENAYLTNVALDAHFDDPTFGYRLVVDELEKAGHAVSERRVWRLRSQQRIWSSFVKQSGSGKRPGPPVHDDLVQRNFSATRMNPPTPKWLEISKFGSLRGTQAYLFTPSWRVLAAEVPDVHETRDTGCDQTT